MELHIYIILSLNRIHPQLFRWIQGKNSVNQNPHISIILRYADIMRTTGIGLLVYIYCNIVAKWRFAIIFLILCWFGLTICFASIHLKSWGQKALGYGYMTARLNSTRVGFNPGWDLSCVYKRRVGMKREEFNKPFSYYPYNFLKRDPAKYTTSLFNPGWTVYMHFSAFLNPGWNLNPASRPGLRFQPRFSCKRTIAFMCVRSWISTRIETCHVNIALVKEWCRCVIPCPLRHFVLARILDADH